MGRRIPSFPVRFELFKPTRFSKEESVMYFAHEWDAHQKSLHHDDQPNSAAPGAPVSPAKTAVSVAPDINQAAVRNAVAAATPAPVAPPATSAPVPISCEPSQLVSNFLTPSVVLRLTNLDVLCCLPVLQNSSRFLPPLPPLLHLPASRSRAIEGDFIRWRSPELIAREYKLANRTSIYRHAHCTGLFAWRRRELGRVLEGMLENHEHIPLEASDAIIRAARVYAHLDENGNWFEPARTNFVFTSPVTALHQLESSMPTNSGRAKRRSKKTRSLRPSLIATFELQEKGQLSEYKGESKFLTATNSRFSAGRSQPPLSLLPCLLASSPLFPYPTTAQMAAVAQALLPANQVATSTALPAPAQASKRSFAKSKRSHSRRQAAWQLKKPSKK